MLVVEGFALLIVTLYVAVRAFSEKDAQRLFLWLGCLSVASWLAEETCIRLYGFYAYDRRWSLFLGHVPILVAVIWPVLIHSARDLAQQLTRSNGRTLPLLTAAIVFTDAALVEPVATGAGLWTWFEPGLFQVPPIALFGWATFAGLSAWTSKKTPQQRSAVADCLLLIVVPVLGTHLALLSLWWTLFRWVRATIDPLFGVMLAWGVSTVLLLRILRKKTGRHLGRKALWLRLPGAVFFFALLAVKGGGWPWLPAYVLAFVPPYLALMSQQYIPWPFGDGA